MFISVLRESLMNLIDGEDFVTLIIASITNAFTCRELNSSNLYDFLYDRYDCDMSRRRRSVRN